MVNYVLILLVVTFAAISGIIFVFTKRIYSPTAGNHIATYANPRKALLVIDVQEDYTGLNGKQPPLYKSVDREITTINGLIDYASQSGMEVAYIRQVFENNIITRLFIRRTIEGLSGTEVDARIKILNQNDFTKRISDAFSNPKLEEFLINHNVDDIYLAGLDAAYCVYYTALGALNRGYKVTVVSDAIMTRKDMDYVFDLYKKNGISGISGKELMNDDGCKEKFIS